MTTKDTWGLIHQDRSALADAFDEIPADQWSTPSWCDQWSVLDVAGHVVAAAEQTFPNFYRELFGAGLNFDRFADRAAKKNAAAGAAELSRRLRDRTTTTNHPPAPVMAMLGEIVVHGQDIRRPLGMTYQSSPEALLAVANNWKNANLLIGAKRRIAGVRLRATDAEWSHGDGPDVSGPLQSLVLAMVGRKGVHVDLTGDGVAVLASRP